ncbi:MAG TPA: twin-arginine translocation signal domain-containing protein [Bellilinea sp.]|nr:twin-arginine translocation signal domain-containing protein [Bellilinea sp.]
MITRREFLKVSGLLAAAAWALRLPRVALTALSLGGGEVPVVVPMTVADGPPIIPPATETPTATATESPTLTPTPTETPEPPPVEHSLYLPHVNK